jgi:hypothetical protein
MRVIIKAGLYTRLVIIKFIDDDYEAATATIKQAFIAVLFK